MSTLENTLADAVSVGEPDLVGPLAVFPLIATQRPALPFFAFAQAVARGVSVRELPEGASVNELLVANPLEQPVLLYEGEEVLGAQQNRTIDDSVLVPPRAQVRVPVHCVEAQRWDASRSGEAFAPAPQVAYPDLRRAKSELKRQRQHAAVRASAEQGAVWSMVAEKAQRHGVASPTAALHDVFERRREQLSALAAAVAVRPGQVGMLAAIGGRFVVVDHVSDPAAFAALHAPLVQGYALDAVEIKETDPPTLADARGFLEALRDVDPVRTEGLAPRIVGLGTRVRVDSPHAAGTALVHDGERIALTAFAHGPRPSARVRRPSRRRPRPS
ncbi:hypothetical protein C8N24_0719 [Solirubrobacter pauli]|uniref:ARG and Rhodanese-Phosphatase-superfamily-associated domain-containing protein n=1 Tax=Solirubrobacter pauli TaxID=166793 RepID=A0A660LCY2_9ACTN|nr:DUF6569 family protein [Solirubrobacter pauli]RKQ90904.1 hypothetical protein C8N24_0719 [Solirubrobacter pauli]